MPFLSRSAPREEGSIIITITMIAILSMLGAAVIARSISAQDSARSAQDFAGALGPADAGVSDALLRLDAIGTSDPPTTFCVGAAACTVTSLSGAPSTQYSWSYDAGTDTIVISSKGTINGRPHAVRAEFKRSGMFPFAIFGQTTLEFKGTSPSKIVAVDKFGNTIPSPDADAGSNGSIDCTAGGGGEHNGKYTGGTVDPDCNNPTDLTGSYNPPPPVADADCSLLPKTEPLTPCVSTAATCPANATTGVIATPVPAGRWLCQRNVSFPPGPVTVTGTANGGVFELFVIPTATSGPLNISFAGSCINVADPAAACANDTDDPADGDPTKFRLNLAGSGVIDPGTGANAIEYNGIVYAPQSDMHSAGCKVRWRGALVFGSAKCSGGPNLDIRYDIRVAKMRGATWTLTNYYEVPSSEVVMPS